MIPLILRIKKSAHKGIAASQDEIIESLYSIFNNAVLHGGTSIWRCYKGNRFSEDIDAYISRDLDKVEALFSIFIKKGFRIEKKKVTKNSIFSVLSMNRNTVRFEAIFKNISGVLKEYETADGNLITVHTLVPEDLIAEKVEAYLKRLKIRDLYDVFFLLRYVKNKKTVQPSLNKLINNFKKPVDEKELKILIIEGLIPTTEKMIVYIKSWS